MKTFYIENNKNKIVGSITLEDNLIELIIAKTLKTNRGLTLGMEIMQTIKPKLLGFFIEQKEGFKMIEEKEVMSVVKELQKTYRKVSTIRDNLGCFADLEDTKSSSVIDQIFCIINSINKKLDTIHEEVVKLK